MYSTMLSAGTGFYPAPAQPSSPGPSSTETSVIPAASEPAVSPFYAKSGKLEDFDIDANLSKLEGERYKQIRPDEPVYFLRLVRLSGEPVRTDLKNLKNHHAEIESLCNKIDNGNWSAVSNHFKPGLRTIDMLYYAFAANRISCNEFNTGIKILKIKEQYQQEIKPLYTGKIEGELKEIQLPSQRQDVEMHFLFESNGDLTKEGQKYLVHQTRNLRNRNVKGGFPPIDEKTCFDKLIQAYRKVPANLQFFCKIGNVDVDAEDYWQQQTNSMQMPLAAAPDEPDSIEKEKRSNYSYEPSSGMLHEFRVAWSPDPVHPVYCLGSAGELVTELHLQGRHIVSIRDDRIKSNLLIQHGHVAGHLEGIRHDEHLHCMTASEYTPEQREMCCRTLPDAIKRAVNPADPYESTLAKRIAAEISDLSVAMARHYQLQHFLVNAAKRALLKIKLESTRHEKTVISSNLFENCERDLAFMEKALNEIKRTPTRSAIPSTLGQGRDWRNFEAFLLSMKRTLNMVPN